MTTPSVPHRFEHSIEVPGTPAQVWEAIATANGISSWMMPTDLDEREGGAVVFHMGPDASSEGTITGWDPPHRIVYEEPNWAALAGQDPSSVGPLVSEFVIEARSGGTCVVKVVSSAFGQGADWENEFFDEMAKGWAPMFENLRLYLAHFPGEQVTPLEVWGETSVPPAEAVERIRRALGIDRVGQVIDVRGSKGEVERITDEGVLLRLTNPVPGLLGLYAFSTGPDTTGVRVAGYLFADEAADYAEREQPAWRAWLQGLDLAKESGTSAAP